ncbi:MAG: response regulator transcription factor [Gammaproteobacteria bacterium]|nr:response regulator transcription factor [Gammaproteobacteria bacterium]
MGHPFEEQQDRASGLTAAVLPRSKISILILEECGLFRDGLRALLESDHAYEVVGATASRREALQLLIAQRPQILMLDFTPTLKTGPETVAHIKRRWPELTVMVLTTRREEPYVEAALRAGANAFLLKSDCRADLFSALQRLRSGKGYISPPALEKVVNGFVRGADQPMNRTAALLTHREQEVIALVARGYRTREMAALLSLSHKTVEKHRTNLMRKLGLRSAAAVAAYAITHGFL